MCGISGFINPSGKLSDLLALQKELNHRGPDASGYFFENGVGLAHNRLSIIDLSHAADQPFYFEDLIIIYNGEIYNYKEIRQDLAKAGYDFTTSSDTEVLIKGFHCWGPKVLDKLIGMFAFALYDRKTTCLYLCRDRLGVKPLYYSVRGSTITFASELKAFLKTSSFLQIGENGFSEYLKYGYTISNNTFFESIKKVPPGHYLIFQHGKVKLEKYWDASDYLHDPLELSENQLTDQLEELMVSSFRYRMVSDVPVGVFFSGGVDSTALVAMLSKHEGPINTFTIGFDDPRFDETPYAREIAKYFKTNHTERTLSMEDARKRLQEFYKIYDEPFYDSSGIPVSLVTEVAKEAGMKVVLSSEGGDELFAGYPSYQYYFERGKKIFGIPNNLRKPVGAMLEVANQIFPVKSIGNKLGKAAQLTESKDWIDFYLTSISSVSNGVMKKYVSGWSPAGESYLPDEVLKGNHHPIELFMLWDLKYLMPNDFLMKIDRATMYHGVESREPFLDHRLVEFGLRLPLHYKIREGKTKYLLRKVLERYIPSSFIDRPKMGFSIPLFSWFKKDLDSLFYQKLTKQEFSRNWPRLDYSWVQREIDLYNHSKRVNKELNLIMMWKFLGLMLWRDQYKQA